MEILACIPIQASQAKTIADSGQDIQVYVANNDLITTFDIDTSQREATEEAELAALQIASVDALRRFGERFVLVAEVSPAQLGEGQEKSNGGMRLSGLKRSQLTAYFSDAEGVEPEAKLKEQLANATLDQAWELAADFLAENDLLWHSITELEN